MIDINGPAIRSGALRFRTMRMFTIAPRSRRGNGAHLDELWIQIARSLAMRTQVERQPESAIDPQ
jgi:hypothetical protein